MMTPQEAAIRLREWYIAFDRHGKGNEPAVKEILEAADVLESIAADLDTLREFTQELAKRNEELHKEKLAAVLHVPRWISVEERLPEKQLRVIVCNGHGVVTVGWRSYHRDKAGTELWVIGDEPHKANDIVLWMPLPEPPEEDEV